MARSKPPPDVVPDLRMGWMTDRLALGCELTSKLHDFGQWSYLGCRGHGNWRLAKIEHDPRQRTLFAALASPVESFNGRARRG
jgi:hypothetical protein